MVLVDLEHNCIVILLLFQNKSQQLSVFFRLASDQLWGVWCWNLLAHLFLNSHWQQGPYEKHMCIFVFSTMEIDISTILMLAPPPTSICLGNAGIYSPPMSLYVSINESEENEKHISQCPILLLLTTQMFIFVEAKFDWTFCLGKLGKDREIEREGEKKGERGHNSDHMFNVTLIILN